LLYNNILLLPCLEYTQRHWDSDAGVDLTYDLHGQPYGYQFLDEESTRMVGPPTPPLLVQHVFSPDNPLPTVGPFAFSFTDNTEKFTILPSIQGYDQSPLDPGGGNLYPSPVTSVQSQVLHQPRQTPVNAHIHPGYRYMTPVDQAPPVPNPSPCTLPSPLQYSKESGLKKVS
jgi:hypothetical protein